MAVNPHYVKLRTMMADAYETRAKKTFGDINVYDRKWFENEATVMLDAIWPEFVELLATKIEYEHALEHTADRKTHTNYSMVFCEDCANLAQSALDGVNREMCREMVTDP